MPIVIPRFYLPFAYVFLHSAEQDKANMHTSRSRIYNDEKEKYNINCPLQCQKE